MPKKFELDASEAELAAVDSLLAVHTPQEDPIGSFQLSKRREKLLAQIEHLRGEHRNKASVALIFGGEPVVGARAIDAEFAGQALEGFQSLVTRRFAELEVGDLGRRGPLPMERMSRLMVTDTVRGSFGFILEEPDHQSALADTELKTVVDDATQVIEKMASSDELLFEEVIDQVDGRTIGALRQLFRVLDDSRATFKVVDDERAVEFNRESIQRARIRADRTEVVDRETVFLSGVMQGFLPLHKKFEFRLDADGTVIYGSITSEFARRVQGRTAEFADKRWNARFKVREVTRRGLEPKMSYVLLELAVPAIASGP